MPKAYLRTDVQQPGIRGEVNGSDVQAKDASRSENHRRVTDRIGGHKKDQLLSLTRQPPEAPHVLVLVALRATPRVRKRKPSGELGWTQSPAKLDQCAGVAVRLLDDPSLNAPIERTGDHRRQQRTRRLFFQSAELEFGQTCQVIRGENGRPRSE